MPLLGLVLGLIGLKKEPAGKGMAITGVIFNGLMIAGWVVLVMMLLGFGTAAVVSRAQPSHCLQDRARRAAWRRARPRWFADAKVGQAAPASLAQRAGTTYPCPTLACSPQKETPGIGQGGGSPVPDVSNHTKAGDR